MCTQTLKTWFSWVIFNRHGTCQVTCQSLPTVLQHTNNNNKNTTMCLLLSSGKQLKALFITTVSTSLLINIWLGSQPSQISQLSFSPCPDSSFLPGSALPAHQECRQVQLLPILCCTELTLRLSQKGSVHDKWVIDRRGPFLLPENYIETLGCSFAWCISKHKVSHFARN